jgi:hypothetical protein
MKESAIATLIATFGPGNRHKVSIDTIVGVHSTG